MKRLIKKLLGIKESEITEYYDQLSQSTSYGESQFLHNVMHCSCDFGIIVCTGCKGEKESELGKCAGCEK